MNCISPGAIRRETPHDCSRGTWLRRGGEPAEVAALAAFLASDEAAFITGANYLIDGGRTPGRVSAAAGGAPADEAGKPGREMGSRAGISHRTAPQACSGRWWKE